jgi:hypothetical protein
MTSATQIKIEMELLGLAQVRSGLRAAGDEATVLQTRINRSVGVGRDSDTGGLLSAGAAAAQMQQRLNNDIARRESLRLEGLRNQFKVASVEGERFGTMLDSLDPRLAMLAGRLIGVDAGLLKLGLRFGVFGAGAAASVAVLINSLDGLREKMVALEMQDPGRVNTLLNSLGIGPGWDVDVAKQRARQRADSDQVANELIGETKPEDWEQTLRDRVANLRQAGIEMRGAELRELRDQVKAEVEERNRAVEEAANFEANRRAQIERDAAGNRVQAFNDYMAVVRAAETSATARNLLSEAEKLYKAGQFGRLGFLANIQLPKNLAAQRDADDRAPLAQRWQQEQDAAFREQVAERLAPMQSALGQWQNAAGQPRFAGADAAGSVEAYRATIAAGSDQKGIIERQLAEQVKMVRLLEDIVRGRSTANIALVSLEGM